MTSWIKSTSSGTEAMFEVYLAQSIKTVMLDGVY
jgi:hypothetical protein